MGTIVLTYKFWKFSSRIVFLQLFSHHDVSRVMRVAINQVKNVRYASSGPAAMTTEYKAPLDAPSPPVNRGWNPSYKARVETAEATKIADEALIHETLAMDAERPVHLLFGRSDVIIWKFIQAVGLVGIALALNNTYTLAFPPKNN